MGTVLIDILKGKSEEEISDYVVDFKKNMINRPQSEIAQELGSQELIKVYAKGKRQLFQFSKGTPAHVKAAISYNDCLKHFNAPFKYEPMKNGDKVKWVYLKTNPLGLDKLHLQLQ